MGSDRGEAGEVGGGGGQLGKDVNSIINTCSFVYCSLLAVFLYWKHHKKKEGQVLNKPQMRLLLKILEIANPDRYLFQFVITTETNLTS